MLKSVIFNNIEYNINLELVENFNDYLVNSIKEIRNSIEDEQNKNQIPVIDCRFILCEISLLKLGDICKIVYLSFLDQ